MTLVDRTPLPTSVPDRCCHTDGTNDAAVQYLRDLRGVGNRLAHRLTNGEKRDLAIGAALAEAAQ